MVTCPGCPLPLPESVFACILWSRKAGVYFHLFLILFLTLSHPRSDCWVKSIKAVVCVHLLCVKECVSFCFTAQIWKYCNNCVCVSFHTVFCYCSVMNPCAAVALQ
uniref:Secreted protein n=1 Tax=Amphiprion ocellaris TaxID=80972 RepID=A0AAQ5XEL6_AMPOC